MKIFNSAIVVLLSIFSLSLTAQTTDKQAKELLNEASNKIKSYDNLSIVFNYTLVNDKVNPPITQNERGTIAIQGDNYHLNFMGMEQIRSGNKLYNILKADKEVQVTEYEDGEDVGLTPSSILSLYKKGYSYKMGDTKQVNGKTIQYVELKANASEEIDHIEIGIEKDTKQLVSLKQWGTNGAVTTFTITVFKPNQNFPANYFSFNKSDYPGYYIAE